MKHFIFLSLLASLFLVQCSASKPVEEITIKATQIDASLFGEQILNLAPLPFEVRTPDTWTLQSGKESVKLFLEKEIQMEFYLDDYEKSIPVGYSAERSVDQSKIWIFCAKDRINCLVQIQGEGLFEAKLFNKEAYNVLKNLR